MIQNEWHIFKNACKDVCFSDFRVRLNFDIYFFLEDITLKFLTMCFVLLGQYTSFCKDYTHFFPILSNEYSLLKMEIVFFIRQIRP